MERAGDKKRQGDIEIIREGTDKRQHDKLIESDKYIALSALRGVQEFIAGNKQDKALKLEVAYERDREDWVTLDSNYQRELVYNIEHAVHHMAIMKIGIHEVAPYVRLSPDFGIAVSTLRFKEASAIDR